MKFAKIFGLVIAVVISFAWTMRAYAQTCASPMAWHPGEKGNIRILDTTCGHETGIISVCQTSFGAPGEAYIALIVVEDLASFTDITITGGTGYTYAAYLVPAASGCNSDAACTTSASGNITLKHLNIPAGRYYLIITGADFDSPGACGQFSLLSNGSLPIALQSFDID